MDPSAKPSTHLPAQPNVPPYALPMLPMDIDDGISYKGFFLPIPSSVLFAIFED